MNLTKNKYFNPHSHEGSDEIYRTLREYKVISIHTPTKGVTGVMEIMVMLVMISIHTPTKGVTGFKSGLNELLGDFNPHSHEGSDTMAEYLAVSAQISIHTPTKGVTTTLGYQLCAQHISIHTPTKGVTGVSILGVAGSYISIHTPTKGVTKHTQNLFKVTTNFNPHSHEGSDIQCV